MEFKNLNDKRKAAQERVAELGKQLEMAEDDLRGAEGTMATYIIGMGKGDEGVLFEGKWYRVFKYKDEMRLQIDDGPLVIS